MENKVGILEKLGYGSLTISCNIVIQFVNIFILFYLTDVFGISPAAAGAVISFGIIWDGINDPLIANYADNYRFNNGERVRPYMLYISTPLAIFTILMFTPFSFPQNLKVAYIIFMYIIFYSLTTFLRLPSYAMQSLATPNQQERLSISTYISGGASLGGVLASVMCWPLVRLFSGLGAGGEMINPRRGFPLTAAVIGIIIIAGSFFSYFTSNERVRPKSSTESRLNLLQSFKFTVKDYNFRWNTAFSTLYFVNNTLMTATLVYYCTYVFKRPGAATVIMGIFALGSILALPSIKKIDRMLGRRKAMMLGALLIFMSKILFVIFPLNIMTIYVYAMIMGLSVPLNIVTFSTTRAEVADHIEYVNKRRIDSMVINFMGFLNKCGTSLTTLAIGLVLQWAGYQAGISDQSQSVTTALIIIMGWASMAFAILMLYCGSRITIETVVMEMKGEKSDA